MKKTRPVGAPDEKRSEKMVTFFFLKKGAQL
jgi:hypothetical protein